MSETRKSVHRKKSAADRSAGRKRIKLTRADRRIHRVHEDDRISARRKLCTALGFWQVCGHTPCQRGHSCSHPDNECHGRFWPMVPGSIKHMLHAGIEARAAGLSEADAVAAMDDALKRYEEAEAWQAERAKQAAPPVPPRPVAAPAPVTPRIRVL
jgi:hypothetical protein